MDTRQSISGDPDRTARLFTGKQAFREVVLCGPGNVLKWHCHEYPCELARWNYHPEYELHLIQHAHGQFVVGDFVGDFSDGNLCLIGPSLPHHWYSRIRKGTVLADRDVVLQFDGQAIASALHYLPEAAPLTRLLAQAARGIEFFGATRALAAQELMKMGKCKGIQRLSHFFQLFTILAQAPGNDRRLLASRWFQPCNDPNAAPVIDKVLDYMLTHQGEPIRMSEVARMAGMTETVFSRFFKRAAGKGFSETVRAMRVVHACRLLRDTPLAISEICFASGYDNLSNFNRRFREETGMTPSAYRAEHHAKGLDEPA